MKKYWLALGWWAARWFIHIWVLKYLEEQNIEIQEVSGTSMWAIIAWMVAVWKTSKEIIDFANSLNFLALIDIDFKTWLLKGEKIEKKLFDVFWDLKIEETKIPLKIVATNLETSEYKIFTKWSIVEAIRASISLPWAFIPKIIEGNSYADGGIIMNLPIEPLESEDVIAVSALKIKKWEIIKKRKFLWFSFKSWFLENNYEIIKRSVLLMMKVNEDVSMKTNNKKITLIRPDFWDLDLLDFNKINDFIDLWYSEAKKTLSP